MKVFDQTVLRVWSRQGEINNENGHCDLDKEVKVTEIL
jgi:hypothetical protein